MRSAIVLCAGRSQRFSGGQKNKTLYRLNGKPLFLYSIEALKALDLIVMVIRGSERTRFEEYLDGYDIVFVEGGERRQDSVVNALRVIPQSSKVLIHDGARPFLTSDLVQRVENKIRSGRCVVPAILSDDTLRIEQNGKYTFIDRNKVFRMQTPQGCIAGEALELYERFSKIDLPDDAMAFEMAGLDVKIVEGDKRNLKITTKEDIPILEHYMTVDKSF